MSTPFDPARLRFAEAARMAALYELDVRMLADKSEALRRKALAYKLEDVEAAVWAHFDSSLTADERTTLSAVRRIRNKLLHCEFWTAESLVETHAGRPLGTANMHLIEIATGITTPLRDLSESHSRLFGWVVEGATDGGLFEVAEATFCDAIRVIQRLFDVR